MTPGVLVGLFVCSWRNGSGAGRGTDCRASVRTGSQGRGRRRADEDISPYGCCARGRGGQEVLRTEGMSVEEAWRQTFTDYVERVVDTGVRSGRYGLIAGLSEYGGEYFRQHPEAFNALVNGKTGWSGGMQGLQPGGAQGLLGLPGATLAPGGRMGGMPMLPGPAAVKDDWETALEEAVTEQGVGDPEDVDISGENGIIISRGIGGAKGWFALPGLAVEGNISVEGAGKVTGSLDGLTQAEKTMVDDLVKQGKNVETIPRSNVPGNKTPDFKVNNVKTELKTLQNPNTSTGAKRIYKGFQQGAETVILDGRQAGLTKQHAEEILRRASGKYPNGNMPGKVEIWTNDGIITYP